MSTTDAAPAILAVNYDKIAFNFINTLSNGDNPGSPNETGPWKEDCLALLDAFKIDGASGVARAFKMLAAKKPALARLMTETPAEAPAEEPVVFADTTFEYQDLPKEIQFDLEDSIRRGCPWLGEYRAFSRIWAPRSAEDFHIANAVWLLASVAAGRVVRPGLAPFENTTMYINLIADSSLFSKTTSTNIAKAVLNKIGLGDSVLSTDITPQKMVNEMAGIVPTNFGTFSEITKAKWRKKIIFAGQRTWAVEEFGGHLKAMLSQGGAKADFHSLLRRMADPQLNYENSTITRGTDRIESPYLCLLGTLAPDELKALAGRGSKSTLWSDGTMARIGFIFPSREEEEARKEERRKGVVRDRPEGIVAEIPQAITAPLEEWHIRLGIPEVEIVPSESDPDLYVRSPEIVELPQRFCHFTQAARDAKNAYERALECLLEKFGNNDLNSSYNRLNKKAERMAMLFASLTNEGVVELHHWALAQCIAERWRLSLHELYIRLMMNEETESEELEKRVLGKIQAHMDKHGVAPTPREIKQAIGKGPSVGILREKVLMPAEKAGLLVQVTEGKRKAFAIANYTQRK